MLIEAESVLAGANSEGESEAAVDDGESEAMMTTGRMCVRSWDRCILVRVRSRTTH